MGNILIDENVMYDIANSIRGKTGNQNTLYPSDMPTEIDNIPTSASGIPTFGSYTDVVNEIDLPVNSLFFVDHSTHKFTEDTQSNFVSFPKMVSFDSTEFQNLYDEAVLQGGEYYIFLDIINYPMIIESGQVSNCYVSYNANNDVFQVHIEINALYNPNEVIDLEFNYTRVQATTPTNRIYYEQAYSGGTTLPISYGGEIQDNIYYIPGLVLSSQPDTYNLLRFIEENIKFYISSNVYHSTLMFSWYYTYTIAKTTLPTLDLCVLTASNLDMITPSYNIISNAIFDSSNITTSFEFQSPVSSIYPAMYSLSLDYSSQINDSSSQDLSNIGFRTKTLYLYNMQDVVGSGQLPFIKNFSSYTPLETIIISGLDNPNYYYQGNNNFIDFSNIENNPIRSY